MLLLQYGESGAPDVWFEPTQVWEVKAADLSISPLHQAALGLVEPGKGISIRYADWHNFRASLSSIGSSSVCFADISSDCSKDMPNWPSNRSLDIR